MFLMKQSGIESGVIKLPKGVSSQGKSGTVQILNLVLHSSKQKKGRCNKENRHHLRLVQHK